VLSPGRIKVESSRIRYVTTGVIRYDRDVVADLILIRIAFGGIKLLADGHVRRPGYPDIRAIGIEQLRQEVAGVVAGIEPYCVKPSIGRH
jgi:hypothetical protein